MNTINYLRKNRGYGRHEVYGVTWGTPDDAGGNTVTQLYECSDLKTVRSLVWPPHTQLETFLCAQNIHTSTTQEHAKLGQTIFLQLLGIHAGRTFVAGITPPPSRRKPPTYTY